MGILTEQRDVLELLEDVKDVLTVMDYDFDEANRHDETKEAYERIRPLLAKSPRILALARNMGDVLRLVEYESRVFGGLTERGKQLLLVTLSEYDAEVGNEARQLPRHQKA